MVKGHVARVGRRLSRARARVLLPTSRDHISFPERSSLSTSIMSSWTYCGLSLERTVALTILLGYTSRTLSSPSSTPTRPSAILAPT